MWRLIFLPGAAAESPDTGQSPTAGTWMRSFCLAPVLLPGPPPMSAKAVAKGHIPLAVPFHPDLGGNADSAARPQTPSLRLDSIIHHYLVLPKLLYLSLNMSVYASYTFIARYLAIEWGIPLHGYAFMSGLSAASLFGSLLWTSLADRRGHHRAVIVLAALAYVLTFCSLRIGYLQGLNPVGKSLVMAIFYGLSTFFISALYPLVDNRVLAMLAEDRRFSKELFGRQRLWGSVGQAAITLINGYGIRFFGFDFMFLSVSISTAVFIIVVLCGISDRRKLCSLFTTADPSDNLLPVRPRESPLPGPERLPIIKPILSLLKSFEFCFFLTIVLVTGYARAVMGNFLPYYLETQLGQSPDQVGWVMICRIVSEVAIFFFGKPLLSYFGVHWMLLMAQAAGALRVLIYALIPTRPEWAVVAYPTEVLKGLNNACLVSAGVRLAHDLAPEGCATTAQGFFSGVHGSLATAAAGIIGGLVLHSQQGNPAALKNLFQYTAVGSIVALLCFMAKSSAVNFRCHVRGDKHAVSSVN